MLLESPVTLLENSNSTGISITHGNLHMKSVMFIVHATGIISGLYYKHVTIVNDNYSGISK